MERGTALPRSSRIVRRAFLVLCLGALALLLVGASLSTVSSNKEKRQHRPVVENRTKAFRIVSEEDSDDAVVLRFENTSTLTITAYTLSQGQERLGADFFPNTAQKGVAPGTTEEVRIPYINFSSKSPVKIIVLTVVFEDHSSEGDSQAAKLIFDRRQGYRVQMSRIRSLLFKAADTSDPDTIGASAASLEQIKARISSLPERDDDNPSPGMKSGLNFAKQWTLKQIARLEAGEMDSEIQHSSAVAEPTQAMSKLSSKISDGLKYIVGKTDEVTAKL